MFPIKVEIQTNWFAFAAINILDPRCEISVIEAKVYRMSEHILRY